MLGLLHDLVRPMSHGEVAEHMADQAWDRATIYRNLIDMSDAGLLRRSDMGDHVWRFELATSDHHAEEHPHFVCTECGTVECLPEIELKLQRRKRAPRALRKREIEVHVRGLCDNCY